MSLMNGLIYILFEQRHDLHLEKYNVLAIYFKYNDKKLAHTHLRSNITYTRDL
jgi:hypothetical protein